MSSILRGRGVAAVLIAVGLSAAAVTAHGQMAQWEASLTGGSVVPSVTSSSSGTFTMTVDGTTATFTLNVESIQSATAAHIHLGAAGENGGVVAVLFAPSDAANSIAVRGTITELVGSLADDMVGFGTALSEGQLYVQVHTEANAPGELRGQIVPQFMVTATGNAGIASAHSSGSAPLATLGILASMALVLGGRGLTARTRRVE